MKKNVVFTYGQLEQLKELEQMPIDTTSSQTIAKPNVVGSVVEIEIPLTFCPKCNNTDIQQHTKGKDILLKCRTKVDRYSSAETEAK